MIFGTALVLCLVAACKKDNKRSTKTYLVYQQITDTRGNGGGLDTATYTYDEQDRPVSITDFNGQGKVTFKVTYDSQNRVSTAKKYNSSGGLIIEYDFFYNGSDAGYYFYGPVHAADTAAFVFNDKHQVTEIDSRHSGKTAFTYDSNGNVGTTQGYNPDGTYNFGDESAFAYDDRKNPFSKMAPANNLFVQYILFIDSPSTLINNVASWNGEPYTYTYNTDGYPVSAVWTLYNNNKVKIYYSYIVK